MLAVLLLTINVLNLYPLESFRLNGLFKNSFIISKECKRIFVDRPCFLSAKKDKKSSAYKTAPPTKSEKQGRWETSKVINER